MSIKFKKLFSLVAAATLISGTVATMASCSDEYALANKLTYAEGTVSENGGFVVKKGDYIYFINGAEAYTASNEIGDVVKGSLMRIKESDVTKKDAKAETVIPMIVGTQSFNGFFIYGDDIYFATPATDKNMDGEVGNTWIDFKKADLKNSTVMTDYYFRLDNNATNYRFVKVGETVYCMYEYNGELHSFNTVSKADTVLVKNASSNFYFNSDDLSDPNVYYTMNVQYDLESGSSYSYNQLYTVNAAATIASYSYNEDAQTCQYTVTGGKTYTFVTDYMEEANEAAAEAETDAVYDFNDPATYPYVNLGSLVLDGVGKTAVKTQFNDANADLSQATEPQGYKYAISAYNKNGIYLTKSEIVKTETEAEASALYYMPANRTNWNAITSNASLGVVAKDTTKATATSLYFYEGGVHSYIYVSGDALYRATAAEDGAIANEVKIASGLSGVTLWKTAGNYVYYYSAGTDGNKLSRVNYTGEAKDYNALIATDEFKPITIAYAEFTGSTSWYMPELIGDVFYYADAQKIDGVAYNYVNAVKLPATQAEIKALNEKYEKVQEYINACASDMQKVLKYYFRTGETTVFDDAVALKLYTAEEAKVLADFKEGKAQNEKELPLGADGKAIISETAFVTRLGGYSEEDVELMTEGWVNTLRHEEETEEEEGWPTWAIITAAVGGGVLLILLITVPVIVVNNKKKARQKAEATVNAYKRKKIDTTDDKSIDVYADDEAETSDNE